MIGETVGNYRILSELGAGGMGVVYLAEHTMIGRRAAIKVLLPEMSVNQEMVGRFFNEARSSAQIKHIGLIDVFDFGYHASGCAYIAMEYLEGESLASMLRRETTLPIEYVTAIARQVATAVGAAHARNIVHRDLKPDNIFLLADEEVGVGLRAKVLDFGIAKLGAELSGVSKTRTGSLMGTPLYMSPEQCRGAGNVDLRSDVYALGCIIYEMTAGATPFVRDGMGSVIGAHIYEAPVPLSQAAKGTPAWLEAVVAKALAKDPADRHQTMDELVRELGGHGSRPSRELKVKSQPSLPAVTPALRTPGADMRTTPMPYRTSPPLSPFSATIEAERPNTLSSAASEVGAAAGKKKRTGLALGIGAGLALATAAVAVFVVVGGSKKETPSPPAPSVALTSPSESPAESEPPAASAPALPSPSPAASESASPTPVASVSPEPTAPVPTVKVELTSSPSGADVVLADGTSLGKTPLTLERAQGDGSLEVTLKLAGYKDEPRTFSLRADVTEKLRLSRQRGGKVSSSGGKPTGKPPGVKAPNSVIDPFAPR